MYSHQGSYTTTQIQGAVLIANTTGLASSQAPNNSVFDFHSTPSTLTNGIYYSSCWIQAATPSVSYKVLSFHEISQ
jgi:aminopeptidase C